MSPNANVRIYYCGECASYNGYGLPVDGDLLPGGRLYEVAREQFGLDAGLPFTFPDSGVDGAFIYDKAQNELVQTASCCKKCRSQKLRFIDPETGVLCYRPRPLV